MLRKVLLRPGIFLPAPVPIPVPVSVPASVSVSVSVSVPVSVSVSVSIPVYYHLALSRYLSFPLSVFLSLAVSLALSLAHSLSCPRSLSLLFSLSHTRTLSPCRMSSLSLSLSPSLPLSLYVCARAWRAHTPQERAFQRFVGFGSFFGGCHYWRDKIHTQTPPSYTSNFTHCRTGGGAGVTYHTSNITCFVHGHYAHAAVPKSSLRGASCAGLRGRQEEGAA